MLFIGIKTGGLKGSYRFVKFYLLDLTSNVIG
jgi:hypothetical protein